MERHQKQQVQGIVSTSVFGACSKIQDPQTAASRVKSVKRLPHQQVSGEHHNLLPTPKVGLMVNREGNFKTDGSNLGANCDQSPSQKSKRQNKSFNYEKNESRGNLAGHPISKEIGINSNLKTGKDDQSHRSRKGDGVTPNGSQSPIAFLNNCDKIEHGDSPNASSVGIMTLQKQVNNIIMINLRYKLELDEKTKKSRVGLVLGEDIVKQRKVAVKLFGGKKELRKQRQKSSNKFDHKSNKTQSLKQQYEFFMNEKDIMLKLKNESGFTKMKDSGYDDVNDMYYIVMNKLDEDLNSIIKRKVDQQLTLQTTINVGLQLLDRLEILHEKGIVHRDLKPKNIMIDYSNQEINLIDFGLSASYLSQHFNHIPFRSTGTILGTPLFASNNALMGKEISRRDDIESMIYILIFCIKGQLPWSGILNMDFLNSEHAKRRILQMRDPNGDLCKGLPTEFKSLLQYAQGLEFDEEPDYERLETIMTLIKEKNQLEDGFEWEKKTQKAASEISNMGVVDSNHLKLVKSHKDISINQRLAVAPSNLSKIDQSRHSSIQPNEEEKVPNFETGLLKKDASCNSGLVKEGLKRKKTKIIKKVIKIVTQQQNLDCSKIEGATGGNSIDLQRVVVNNGSLSRKHGSQTPKDRKENKTAQGSVEVQNGAGEQGHLVKKFVRKLKKKTGNKSTSNHKFFSY